MHLYVESRAWHGKRRPGLALRLSLPAFIRIRECRYQLINEMTLRQHDTAFEA